MHQSNNSKAQDTCETMTSANANAGRYDEDECHDDNALCIICLEKMRNVAFLPCGHVIACRDCATKMSDCPVCRQPRTGLCHVRPFNLNDYICKHCSTVIQPTYFESHREVCAFRQRSINTPGDRVSCGDANADVVQTVCSDRGASPREEGEDLHVVRMGKCAECDDAESKLVICLPCGHRVVCKKCAQSRTACPVCLTDIKYFVVPFDS